VEPVVRHKAEAVGRKAETIWIADPVEDVAKALTTSLNLAVDCLRFSTHFFHPIQQCAQHVYHTALPLSPTSSRLRNSCLQSVIDNQLSPVAAFSGAPNKWGLLLRTINFRPRQLTCIATSAQMIVAACGDIVYSYDAITFVLKQSLHAPEAVTKIQGTPDGSTLFFAHSYSVTMWDVQTGGLTHTFTTRSEITDVAVSTTGDHIACGSSDSFVVLWNIHTKEEGEGFGNGQPVVAICWLAPQEVAVATQNFVYIHDLAAGKTREISSTSDRVWGIVYPGDEHGVLVGTSRPDGGVDQEMSSLTKAEEYPGTQGSVQHPRSHPGRLLRPALAGGRIVCITPPSGVLSFYIPNSYGSSDNPPLLGAATSVAVSLNRNLVVQTEDSLKIFSLDVLTSDRIPNAMRPSHVYLLDEKYIVCLLNPGRYLTVLRLETLEPLPYHNAWPLRPLPTNQSPHVRASFSLGLVAEFGISAVIKALQSYTPLPKWTEAADEDAPLSGFSPDLTRIVTFCGSPRWELRVEDSTNGTILAKLPLKRDDLGMGKVYDVTFDSETTFHLKVDGPGRHVQIPHDITVQRWGHHSHTIVKGKPVPLSEPRAAPTYTLDANCEWVIDAESRKICWVPPGNVRRGNGGHFWAGLSLVMVGDDGVVRKLSFREPDS
jgi:WD40 repeat protein